MEFLANKSLRNDFAVTTSKLRFLRYLRLAAIGVAFASSLCAAGSCWVTLTMKNVYFRPVHRAVETGDGDPYMIALDCVAAIADRLTGPITVLVLSTLVLFVFAIQPWPPRSEDSMPDHGG